MTAPTGWLDPAAVATWLRLDPVTPADADLLATICAAVQPLVQRYRPDGWVPDTADPPGPPVYLPGADIVQGATIFAAAVWYRRMSPDGVETFTASVAYVQSTDDATRQFLRTGAHALPRVG
jgi:hypothetical protein